MSKLSKAIEKYHETYINKREEAMPDDVMECLANVQNLFRKSYNNKDSNVGKAEDPSSLKQLSEGDPVRPIEILGLSSELGGTEEFDEFQIYIPIIIGRKRWKFTDSNCEQGCWKLHRRIGGLNECCTLDGYLSTKKVDEMFQRTCQSLQDDKDIDDYDFISTENCRLVVEFGYQTLCVTLTPVIFFDSRYGRRSGNKNDDSPSLWHQDFYAKEQWTLTRFSDRRQVALQAAQVFSRLVDEHMDWPREIADTALRSSLLRRLDYNKGDNASCALHDLVRDVVKLVADGFQDKDEEQGCIQHYFLDGFNILNSASRNSLESMKTFFTSLQKSEANLISAFEN